MDWASFFTGWNSLGTGSEEGHGKQRNQTRFRRDIAAGKSEKPEIQSRKSVIPDTSLHKERSER